MFWEPIKCKTGTRIRFDTEAYVQSQKQNLNTVYVSKCSTGSFLFPLSSFLFSLFHPINVCQSIPWLHHQLGVTRHILKTSHFCWAYSDAFVSQTMHLSTPPPKIPRRDSLFLFHMWALSLAFDELRFLVCSKINANPSITPVVLLLWTSLRFRSLLLSFPPSPLSVFSPCVRLIPHLPFPPLFLLFSPPPQASKNTAPVASASVTRTLTNSLIKERWLSQSLCFLLTEAKSQITRYTISLISKPYSFLLHICKITHSHLS